MGAQRSDDEVDYNRITTAITPSDYLTTIYSLNGIQIVIEYRSTVYFYSN